MRKSDFKKVATQLYCTLLDGYFPVNIQFSYSIAFLKNISGGTACENTYCSGHSISVLLKPCGAEDDVQRNSFQSTHFNYNFQGV